MQALIKISDKQYLVQKGDTLFVPRQKTDIGGTMEIAPWHALTVQIPF